MTILERQQHACRTPRTMRMRMRMRIIQIPRTRRAREFGIRNPGNPGYVERRGGKALAQPRLPVVMKLPRSTQGGWSLREPTVTAAGLKTRPSCVETCSWTLEPPS